MKTQKIISAFLLIIPGFTFTSCTMDKRLYSGGYSVSWNRSTTVPQKSERRLQQSDEYLTASAEKGVTPGISSPRTFEKTADQDSCADLITLKNGSQVRGKILEVNPKTVKYLPCENLSGPVLVTKIENLLELDYSDGIKENYDSNANQRQVNQPAAAMPVEEKSVNGWAIASMVSALCFFLYITIILAPVFGFIAMDQIRKNPEKYKGKGMARFGIIFGLTILSSLFILLLSL